MSQDIVADALNKIMNSVKSDKNIVEIKRYSKLLISILALIKLKGYIKNYEVKEKKLYIEIEKIYGCKAIKPRYIVGMNEIEKYVKRYLPAKNIGVIIVSTNEGLMSHYTAQERNLGGSLIAYIY